MLFKEEKDIRLLRRPCYREGESLTGYLLRAAYANKIEIYDIYNKTNNGLINIPRRVGFHHLDIYPMRLLNLEKLSYLTGLSKECISAMTFEPLIGKLMENVRENEQFVDFTRLLETKHRKFCPICLDQNGGYRNLWQIGELNICDVHKCALTIYCPACGFAQPYIHKNLGGFRCVKCDSLLSAKISNALESNVISEQLIKYKDWYYLLSPQKIISEIENLPREKSLALLEIYIDQSMEEKFQLGRGDFLHQNYVRYLRRMIKSDEPLKSPNLNIMLSLLRNKGMSVEEFSRISISNNFVRDFIDPTKKAAAVKCKAPWCSSNGLNISLVQRKPRNNMFSQIMVCSNCFIKYGRRYGESSWEEIGNDIEIISRVLKVLGLGLRESEICLELGITIYKLKRILGYLAHRHLLPSAYQKKYVPVQFIDDQMILKRFRDLPVYGNISMLKHAQKSFGWKINEYFYNLAYPIVEEFIALRVRKTEKRRTNEKVDNLRQNVLLDIQRAKDDGLEISLKAVAERLRVSPKLLSCYGLTDLIAVEHKKQIRSRSALIYKSRFNEFIMNNRLQERPLLSSEIYRYLKITPSRLREQHPFIAQRVNKALEEYKNRRKK